MAFPPSPRSKGGVEATRVQQEGLGIAARRTNSQPMEGVLREWVGAGPLARKVEATSCQQVAGVSLREVLATSPGLVETFPRTPRTKGGLKPQGLRQKCWVSLRSGMGWAHGRIMGECEGVATPPSRSTRSCGIAPLCYGLANGRIMGECEGVATPPSRSICSCWIHTRGARMLAAAV